MRVLAALILVASFPVCADETAPDPKPVTVSDAREHYADARARLASDRDKLASELSAAKPKERPAIIAKARTRLHTALRDELIPAWFGTKWAFHGTSETPGEGAIACGYFVTTLLSHAGLHVQRARLAQQTSELIVKTLTPDSDIRRYRRGDVDAVISDTVARGDGLYVVGLDFHVGFIDVTNGEARMCHSAVLSPGAVVCEPARTAEGMLSNYHVVGKLLTDDTVRAWLSETTFATR